MKNINTIVIAICLLIVGIYVGTVLSGNKDKQEVMQHEDTQTHTDQEESSERGTPVFTWEYDSFEEDMYPRTTIFVSAEYENGDIEKKEVDTVTGSCNAYEDSETALYEHSSMIICYYAGLGHYYRVIETEGGYAVQRKIFEEGSPEYMPPEQSFEEIVSF